jgi:hypothetical protein
MLFTTYCPVRCKEFRWGNRWVDRFFQSLNDDAPYALVCHPSQFKDFAFVLGVALYRPITVK